MENQFRLQKCEDKDTNMILTKKTETEEKSLDSESKTQMNGADTTMTHT